jgi:protein-tyrosine phosphatase
MNQWWIDENRVIGGSNPSTEELEHLFHIGFNTIISLLRENEQPPRYDVKKIMRLGFDRYSIPIKDFTAPELKQYMKFLEIMNRDTGKVLIHCQGGYGRTGAMAAAYWIDKGLPAHEAIRKVRRLRPGALEITEQEESLYELEGYLSSTDRVT